MLYSGMYTYLIPAVVVTVVGLVIYYLTTAITKSKPTKKDWLAVLLALILGGASSPLASKFLTSREE